MNERVLMVAAVKAAVDLLGMDNPTALDYRRAAANLKQAAEVCRRQAEQTEIMENRYEMIK